MKDSKTATKPDDLADQTIELVSSWLESAKNLESKQDLATMNQLKDLIEDESGVSFVMSFIDRVARPDSNAVAAKQLASLVASSDLPKFLSFVDRIMLKSGAKLGQKLPGIVIPLARKRMRSIVGHLVAPAEKDGLASHLEEQNKDGFQINVNLLGEAVLGEQEAEARLENLIEILSQPDVDYVSVKISAVASQLNHWAYQESLKRTIERAEILFDASTSVTPKTFINFDMEEYKDLHMTIEAFKKVLDDPKRVSVDAGIVLQAYLPDSFLIMKDLVKWANKRHELGGGTIKIRLVKGANLAMEKVDAAVHGWPVAPYSKKIDSDANYRKCVNWIVSKKNLQGVRLGLASHNLFDIAWTKLLAEQRGVIDNVQFEMLQGMASGQAKAVNIDAKHHGFSDLLLYTPVVAKKDFEVAIGYLFRRLEENATDENFMRSLFDLAPGSKEFIKQADFFKSGLALMESVSDQPNRIQDRSKKVIPWVPGADFINEADTDPSLEANQVWIDSIVSLKFSECKTEFLKTKAQVTEVFTKAKKGLTTWQSLSTESRAKILHKVGDELANNRALLISTMMNEASKTISEADSEVSEAIDFAHYYANNISGLAEFEGAEFNPYGVIAVIPPWNFPVAIPAGGVLGALAAGNAVIFKPALETPRCAEIIAELCWSAGIDKDVLQFVRVPDNELGQQIVENSDAVILTGSIETAELFKSWRPEMKLFAETSGKNALIITSSADLDLAAQDLIKSAFGHSGQKCSAASLAILVGDIYKSERFRRQITDAASSLTAGPSTDITTDIAPLVGGVNERLLKAQASLEPSQNWLLKPEVAGSSMSPGILDGVSSDSWFATTECFGPVLGLMFAEDLESAVRIANSSNFGLTGGIHSLDPIEVNYWKNNIEVGNGYINRAITGAIVQRQPFGGWKQSSVGPGVKAGGPNYLMQLGTWNVTKDLKNDYAESWSSHFSVEHDETDLFCEANIFRYVPLKNIAIRIGPNSDLEERLVSEAAKIAGVPTLISYVSDEDEDEFMFRVKNSGAHRIRLVGVKASKELYLNTAKLNVEVLDAPVTPYGRIELQNYVQEQAMSITTHRFGNIVKPITEKHD